MFTDHGIELVDVYLGVGRRAHGHGAGRSRGQRKGGSPACASRTLERKQRDLEHRKSKALEAKIAALRAEFEAEKEELEKDIIEQKQQRGGARTRSSRHGEEPQGRRLLQ